ncbi:auxin efflux carrier [Obba rivulosa]|uniref:Auxin efflux carrier n=1 Tax=Obba rivulosa TaxID=1052685 RepID=A0A8E2J4L1_9APHY|nr:auxin efflux carrier [Obba rivulosa]
MASAAFLIYSGIMPLIKTFIAIFFGYLIAKKDMFPPAASRGASCVTMNVSLPALIFANIVPAFTPSNISALGPLFLTAFTYEGIGFLFGLFIREVCYVPRNFWQGIIIVTGMSNWGNLPNAVVLSVTEQAPFNPATDPALGVSFVSIFIVSYHLTFWVAGAAHSLSWDYLPGVPQGEEAERPVSWKEKPIGKLIARYLLRNEVPSRSLNTPEKDIESFKDEKRCIGEPTCALPAVQSRADNYQDVDADSDVQLTRRTSHLSATSFHSVHPTAVNTATVSRCASMMHPSTSAAPTLHEIPSMIPPAAPKFPFLQRVLKTLKPLTVVITPITLTLAISLPVALIQDLKALFVDVSSEGGPSWHGPDGRPPLAFVMDTAQFLGNIAVPLALVLLGASFARLRVPRPLSRLPIMAMVLVTMAKLVVLPVIGVFLIQSMVKAGMIDKDAKAEKFVAMFLSGTPAAVNQLIVTSLYSPDGTADTLSAFLLIQDIAMFFSSAALTAVALLLL